MQNKVERQWYDDNWEQIIKWNELIGRFCGMEPEIEHCVYHGDNAIRYSPKNVGNYFPTAGIQKQECERYILEQEAKKFVKPAELSTRKIEWWPWFQQDWDMIMLAYEGIVALDTALYTYTITGLSVWVQDESFNGKGMICIEHTSAKQTLKIAAYQCLVRFVEYYNSVNRK